MRVVHGRLVILHVLETFTCCDVVIFMRSHRMCPNYRDAIDENVSWYAVCKQSIGIT